jgi:Ca2+:H+ antiporter
MLFSLKTHHELCCAEHGEEGEAPWPIGLALGTLAGVTVGSAGERSVRRIGAEGGRSFGMTPAFVGFIVIGAGWRGGGNGLGLLGGAKTGST